LNSDWRTIYLCAQLQKWSANYTFKTNIACHRLNGNSYLLSLLHVPRWKRQFFLWHAPCGTAILPAFRGTDLSIQTGGRSGDWKSRSGLQRGKFWAPSLPTIWFTLFSGCGFATPCVREV